MRRRRTIPPDVVSALMDASQTLASIAARVDTTPRSLARMMEELRSNGHAVPERAKLLNQPAEISRRIEELSLAGKKPKEIVVELGVTKNQVLGALFRRRKRAHCAGEEAQVKEVKPQKPEPVRTVTLPTKVDLSLFACDAIDDADDAPAPAPAPEPPEPIAIGVPLVELTGSMCRFSVGYTDQHYFCGNPRRDVQTSYCAEHHSLIWIKPVRIKKKSSGEDEQRRRQSGQNFYPGARRFTNDRH